MHAMLRRLYRSARQVVEKPISSNTALDESCSTKPALDAATHLTLLGWSFRLGGDGWLYVDDAVDGKFCIRPLDYAVRFFAVFVWPAPGTTALQWLEFINRANRAATLVTFALSIEADGAYSVSVSATSPGRYQTSAFGIALRMWQQDLKLLAGAPKPTAAGDELAQRSSDAVH